MLEMELGTFQRPQGHAKHTRCHLSYGPPTAVRLYPLAINRAPGQSENAWQGPSPNSVWVTLLESNWSRAPFWQLTPGKCGSTQRVAEVQQLLLSALYPCHSNAMLTNCYQKVQGCVCHSSLFRNSSPLFRNCCGRRTGRLHRTCTSHMVGPNIHLSC